MRFKEIKPGMVIYCKNDEEKIELLEEADRLGYKWNNNCIPTDCRMIRETGMTIHFHEKGDFVNFKHITWSDKTDGVIEFSDLIIPELTAEEAFSILDEIRKCCRRACNECHLSNSNNDGFGYCSDNYGVRVSDRFGLLEICQQWKSDHEKKEIEVETEWFWQGRIFKINADGCYYQIKDGTGFYDTGCEYRESAEEYMADELKKYCKTHEGEFIAVVEHVCRVKAVE